MINNVDMDKGLARSAGLKDIYMETLDAFIQDGTERMNEMNKSFEAKNLNSYSIHVHGIKSALNLIGADEMSQKAYELEMAAGRGDIDYINAQNENFINALATMVTDVQKYLDKPEQNDLEQKSDEMDIALEELKDALKTKNSVQMNKTINRLIKLSAGTDNHAVFRKISNYIMVCDYEQANELLDVIL